MSEAAAPAVQSTRQVYHEACRELGLRHWDSAADKLAEVLEVLEGQTDPPNSAGEIDAGVEGKDKGKGKSSASDDEPVYGPNSPELAPILHQYGRALMQIAIASSGALGGAPPPTTAAASKSKSGAAAAVGAGADDAAAIGGRFHFGGDIEEEEQGSENDAPEQQDQDDEDDDEEQDDFALAFSVLDMARVAYSKLLAASSPEKGVVLVTYEGKGMDRKDVWQELSDVLSDLGDLGLEMENFTQAASDYEESLSVVEAPEKLGLPEFHRRVADGRLRTGLALEYHPDAATRAKATERIKGAIDALQRRKDEVEAFEQKLKAGAKLDEPFDRFDDIGPLRTLPKAQAELQEVAELLGDLEAKLAEAQAEVSTPAFPLGSKEALQKTIQEAFLGASTNSAPGPSGSSSSSTPFQPTAPAGPVNDLSSRVKRRKTDKKPVDSGKPPTTEFTNANTSRGDGSAAGEKRGAEEQPSA